MNCVICRQAETLERRMPVTLERGEFRLVVNGVPGRVCPSCGDAYMDQATALELLRIGRQTQEAGILDSQCEFSPPQI